MVYTLFLILILLVGLFALTSPYLHHFFGDRFEDMLARWSLFSPLRDATLIGTAIFATYATISLNSDNNSAHLPVMDWSNPGKKTTDNQVDMLENWVGKTAQPPNMVKAGKTSPAPMGRDLPTVDDMIAKLETRLAKEPGDVKGWRMLGWSYFRTKKYQESADAYARAIKLDGKSSKIQSVYGEALVRAANGEIVEEASKAFKAALKLDPSDPRAKFFLGMEKEQKMDPKGALDDWIKLLKEAKPNSDWADNLLERIKELSKRSSIDVADRLPK